MRAEYVLGALFSLAVMAIVAGPAAVAAPAGGGVKSDALKLESIPGSTVKRITLSETAAKRLGIETGVVSKQPIVLRQMVGGLVVARPDKPAPSASPGFGSSMFGGPGAFAVPTPGPKIQPVSTALATAAPAPASGDAWMLVTLAPTEWERVAKNRPARLLPLSTREKSAPELAARPSGLPPVEDAKRSMLKVYYVVPGKDHGLTPNTRMRVELQLAGDEALRTVVPYGAIYYDAQGATWVYLQTAPLTFQRQRVGIERVIGDLAVLSEGPPVKTPVVTVGAALLYGTEIFGK